MASKIYKSSRLDADSLENIVPDNYDEPFTVDLGGLSFITPWGTAGLSSLLLDCVGRGSRFDLVLPRDSSVLAYLKRAHFGNILSEAGLQAQSHQLNQISLQEHDAKDTLLELMRLQGRNEDFYLKASNIIHLFKSMGIEKEKAEYIVSLIGELVDNTFAHNAGNWPHGEHIGGILMAQRYKKTKELEIALSDMGLGIRKTLTANPAYASIRTDREAIIKALEKGVTSRPQGRGGNGFTYIQEALKNGLEGTIDIWSGNSHLRIAGTGINDISDSKWLIGTAIALKVTY